ncbi:MAG TPA: enolase C-terminal domain-like protein [Terriglobia bacterium]|nr:enolase C-terminal domain-like protein [Terriglobia bacterium]
MLTIDAIHTERILLPIRPEWVITGGAGTHNRSPFLIVRVRTEGIEGIGEVSGTHLWSGEGFETAEAAVRNVLAPLLIGRELNPNVVRGVMDNALAGFPFTKAGIDMACWDALAKSCGVSVGTLLGGSVRNSIRSKFSISGVAPHDAATIAKQAWEAGFRKFKVKVGTGLSHDLDRVATVRESLGDEVSLGVDANGGWSLGEARRALPFLEHMGIAAIEQPLHKANLHETAQLRAHSKIPILLDESVWNARDVAMVARLGAADAVNIYVGKAGGILGALEAIQVAEALGVGATLGSNQEMGIGHAAILQVLSVSNGLDLEMYPPDAAGPMYYTADLVEPAFSIKEGEVSVPTGPGLGVSINEEVLRRFRVG